MSLQFLLELNNADFFEDSQQIVENLLLLTNYVVMLIKLTGLRLLCKIIFVDSELLFKNYYQFQLCLLSNSFIAFFSHAPSAR